MNPAIAVIAQTAAQYAQAAKIAQQLNLTLIDSATEQYSLLLYVTPERLELHYSGKPKMNPIYVDFTQGKAAHRRLFGGGRGQLIARAVGLQSHKHPSILDLTAGLGQDAFVLACLGCQVTLLERSPIIAALLADGIRRAQQEEWFSSLVFSLVNIDASVYLQQQLRQAPDVIYLDPMFPETKKTALVKKEMRILRLLVGDDLDAAELLTQALSHAKKRVVVKRPRLATTLSEKKPGLVIEGKSSRFDIYFTS